MNFLRDERVRLFMGGVVATLAGLYAIKSGKAKRFAVKGVACGMQIQSKAYETFQNIKEEATDVVHDANTLEKASYQEMGVKDTN